MKTVPGVLPQRGEPSVRATFLVVFDPMNLSIISQFKDLLSQWLQELLHLSPGGAATITAAVFMLLIAVLAWLVDWVCSKIIVWLVPKIVQKIGSETPRIWEAELKKQGVAKRSAHIVGTMICYFLVPMALADFPNAARGLQNLIEGYLIVVAVMAIIAVVRAARDVWRDSEIGMGISIGFATQALETLLWVVGSILVVSVVFDQSVTVLLSGLAGMTAILALVFRDSILGFVAGIQLSGNNMLKNGDWIEVPQYGANGTVKEIWLTTVKIQNFDKTTTTVPSYALFSGSFKNWRGMWDFQARRIKRSVNLDMNYVRLMLEDEIAQVAKSPLLKHSSWKSQAGETKSTNTTDNSGARQQSNLSLFRDYLVHYLKNHPEICDDKIVMVRQLESTPQGLPVEVYCFCDDINWRHYENVQAEIVEHFLAVLPAFDLRVLQLVNGYPLPADQSVISE